MDVVTYALSKKYTDKKVIEGGGVIVDTALSDTSTNPVQNKVVKAALDEKANTTDIPTSLPANGGNADTVNNHTVNADVPADAVFTDTVYTLPTATATDLGGVVISGTIDSTSTNDTVPTSKAVYDTLPTVSASGNPVTLQGLQGGVPFNRIDIKCANMFPMPYTDDSAETTGIDVVIHDDGTVDVHGGPPSSGHYVVYFCNSTKYMVKIQKGKTYRLISNYEYNVSALNIAGHIRYDSNPDEKVSITLKTGKFTAADDGYIHVFTLWMRTSAVNVDGLWVMMVEDNGGVYDTFIQPIVGRDLQLAVNDTAYTVTPDSNPYTVTNDIRQNDGENVLSITGDGSPVLTVNANRTNAQLTKIYETIDKLTALVDAMEV